MPIQTADEIYSEAAQLGAAERHQFLDRACAGDAALRSKIQRLLDLRSAAADFLEDSPPGLGMAQTIGSPTADGIGSVIGPYKLLEQIGEGGMGLVYMAEQQQPVRRLVALKVIKPGFDSKQTIARFEAERQALAMMDHPNIAKVHDAGTTEMGRPYFSMELVRGIPINEFCNQQKLTVRQRLELFIQVCQAVQHAHQKGIIHRDLKPTNVLVTHADTVPLPKVIDFGIAKALGPALTEHTLHTGFAQLVGTPMYMSPEQAQMNHFGVDTRSDVYSLGVLLYELLTGTTPFDTETLSKAGLDEVRRMIREDDPPRPSVRMSTLTAQALSTISQQRNNDPRRISATLRGELDWIVMKALEKDRGRRYESASALAADIQRYLSDEPVLACPPTTMYRFQKFARKHKPALFTAAAIALCLLLGTTVSAWQAIRATAAEEQANANQVQAQASAKKADEKAQEATTQRDEAQKQRDEVRALNEQIKAVQAQQRSTVYTANMILAQRAWEASDPERASELMDRQRPGPGEADLRGFEWHYLYRLCHSDLLTLKGHRAGVNCVAYSPDGRRIASADWEGDDRGCLKVWDAPTGKELLNLKEGYQCVTFSPDGKRLAGISTSDEYEAKIWSAEDGRELLTLTSDGGHVTKVSFSPDGQLLATTHGAMIRGKYISSSVTIWDAQTGERRRTMGVEIDEQILRRKVLRGHHFCIGFSPDSKRLVAGDASSAAEQEKLVKVWDIQTGQEVLTTKGHAGSIHGVAFSPDGKRIASASADNTLKLWDAQSGDELLTLPGHTGTVWSVTFSPDGKRLASASQDRTVRLWDSETGQELATFKGHSDWVGSMAFSPDGKHLASASADKTVKIWDAAASSNLLTLQGGVTSITSVAFSPDGQRLASVGLGPEGRGVGKGKVWDARTGRELATLKGLASSAWQTSFNVSFNSGGTRIAVVADGQPWPEARVFDARSGEEVFALKGHVTRLTAVAYSPDGKHIASASLARRYSSTSSHPGLASVPAGGIGIWDAESGKLLRTLVGHTDGTQCVAFSPDGTRLASGGGEEASNSDEVKIWNTRTGEQLFAMKHGSGLEGISAVAFSPDGQRLASASYDDRTAKIWDAQTGQEILVLKGHTASVSGVAYSPDGNRIATTGRDKTMKLWNAQTGEELLTLEVHDGWRNGIAFSPDGNLLACGGPDGTIKLYDATPLSEQP